MIGLNSLCNTNRISYGITYRMYDNELKERLRFNIGQGYDFHSQKVKFYPNETSTTYPRTPIATGINLNFLDYVSANGNLVYNTEKGETSSWNSQLNGMYEEFKVQLSYRYLRDGNQTMNGEISDLKQLGGAFNFPIVYPFFFAMRKCRTPAGTVICPPVHAFLALSGRRFSYRI